MIKIYANDAIASENKKQGPAKPTPINPMWDFTEILLQRGLQCLRQLIRAGSVLKSALDAIQPFDHFFGILSFNQGADALQVAVAATHEGHIVYFSVYKIKVDFFGTYAFCFVFIADPFRPFQQDLTEIDAFVTVQPEV